MTTLMVNVAYRVLDAGHDLRSAVTEGLAVGSTVDRLAVEIESSMITFDKVAQGFEDDRGRRAGPPRVRRGHSRQRGRPAFGASGPDGAPRAGRIVMSEYAYDEYEALSFSAAQPGWRALYYILDNPTELYTLPLIGWAVYRITVRDNLHTDDQLSQARQRIEGVILDLTYPSCAVSFEGFLAYLGPPTTPIPSPASACPAGACSASACSASACPARACPLPGCPSRVRFRVSARRPEIPSGDKESALSNIEVISARLV